MVKNVIQSGVVFAKNEINGVPEVKINLQIVMKRIQLRQVRIVEK